MIGWYKNILQSKVPKCSCDPGYGGDRCDTPIKWVEFGPQAFVEYDVKVGLEDKTTDVEVLFLPGKDSTGSKQLGYATSKSKVFMIKPDQSDCYLLR